MFYFVLTIHLLLCLAMIGLVLLQQGKGAAVGAILSGSSNTLFGATGANTLLVKMTTGVAVAFMVTSVLLINMYGERIGHSDNSLGGSVINELVTQDAPPVKTDASSAPVAAAPGGSADPAVPPANAAPVAPAPVAEPAK